MRKVTVFMHMSLDGYVSAADKNLSWSAASESDLFSSVIPQLIKSADTLLLGWVLSDELLGYWLNAEATNARLSEGERAYARWATTARKVILSKKDERPAWPNAEVRVVKDDVDMSKAIAELKQSPGNNILVHGGVRTARDLARLGLVDEYQLVIQPVILGSGHSIFTGMRGLTPLKLTKSEAIDGGGLVTTYEPA
jgi:dihydrofolate reductase